MITKARIMNFKCHGLRGFTDRCLGWLCVLAMVLGAGCTTRSILEGDWERDTHGLDEYRVHEAMVRAGEALDWEIVSEELRTVRLSTEGPRWKLVVDVVNGPTNVTVRVVDAVGLKYSAQDGSIHRAGNNAVHALLDRMADTLAEAVRQRDVVPYVVRNRIVDVSPGRSLTSVVLAVCGRYGLAGERVDDHAVRISCPNVSGELSFVLSVGDVAFSIVPNEKLNSPDLIATGNAIARILEREIVQYADLSAHDQKRQAAREHRQQLRTENEVRRVRRAVLFVF